MESTEKQTTANEGLVTHLLGMLEMRHAARAGQGMWQVTVFSEDKTMMSSGIYHKAALQALNETLAEWRKNKPEEFKEAKRRYYLVIGRPIEGTL